MRERGEGGILLGNRSIWPRRSLAHLLERLLLRRALPKELVKREDRRLVRVRQAQLAAVGAGDRERRRLVALCRPHAAEDADVALELLDRVMQLCGAKKKGGAGGDGGAVAVSSAGGAGSGSASGRHWRLGAAREVARAVCTTTRVASHRGTASSCRAAATRAARCASPR
eukprot:2665240-Prymnesium_polylepis.1